MARGVLAGGRLLDPTVVLDALLRARAALHLPPHDLVEPFVDRLLSEVQEDRRWESRRVAELREELRRAAGEHEALARRYEEAVRAREDLEQDLQELAAQRDKARVADSVTAEDVTSRSDYQSLRYRARELEQERNQAHSHCNGIRRELARLRAEHEQLEAQQQVPDGPAEDQDDLDGDELRPVEQQVDRYPAGLPRYPSRFWRTLKPLPAYIRREALVLIARLAAGDAEAYLGAKPLNEAPGCWEQRVAKDYRLIFRGPSRDGVFEVEDLIDRKNLERWLRSRR